MRIGIRPPALTGAAGAGLARRAAAAASAGASAVHEDGMTVCVSRRGPRPVITVRGALDTGGAALLSAMIEHVRRTEGRAAEVDLTRVDYVDSHGLAPVLDEDVTVRGASPLVMRLLDVLQQPVPTSASDRWLPEVPHRRVGDRSPRRRSAV